GRGLAQDRARAVLGAGSDRVAGLVEAGVLAGAVRHCGDGPAAERVVAVRGGGTGAIDGRGDLAGRVVAVARGHSGRAGGRGQVASRVGVGTGRGVGGQARLADDLGSGELAAQIVVGGLALRTDWVGDRQLLAVGVVGVMRDPAARLGDCGHVAELVVPVGRGVPQGVCDGGQLADTVVDPRRSSGDRGAGPGRSVRRQGDRDLPAVGVVVGGDEVAVRVFAADLLAERVVAVAGDWTHCYRTSAVD